MDGAREVFASWLPAPNCAATTHVDVAVNCMFHSYDFISQTRPAYLVVRRDLVESEIVSSASSIAEKRGVCARALSVSLSGGSNARQQH